VQSVRHASSPPIVFYDGVCNLCDAFVDFAVRHDRRAVFRYAPLQGTTAAAYLDPTFREMLTSVALLDDGTVYRKSDAALRVLAGMGGAWRLALIFLLVPLPIRDWVYDHVAHNRYRWFGKRTSCRIPTPEERGRFLE